MPGSYGARDVRATPSRTRRLGDRRGDARAYVPVEDARDHVLGAELVVQDHRRERVARGDLHPFGDPARADVQRSSEDAREREHVVDLVGVVRAPGPDDGDDVVDLPGATSGVGLAIAKTIAPSAIVRTPAAVTAPRSREADEDVRAGEQLVGRALLAVRVRPLGERRLRRAETRSAAVHGAVPVGADHVAGAGVEEDVGGRDARGADAGDHDLDVLDPLADDLERVDERGERDDRRAVLVVVEHGDVELGAQALLDLEAARRRDVLEVDAAEGRRDRHAERDDLVDVLRRDADGEGVHAAELLEEDGLALHHRHRRLRPDVAEAEYRGAVRDDRDGVLLDRQLPCRSPGRPRSPRRCGRPRGVGHREVVSRLEGRPRHHLELATEVQEEGAVGDVLDLDAVDGPDGFDDQVEVVRARCLHSHVADLLVPLDADEVDRAERASGGADRVGDARERPGCIGQVHPQRGAVGRGQVRHAVITPRAASAAIVSSS